MEIERHVAQNSFWLFPEQTGLAYIQNFRKKTKEKAENALKAYFANK